VGNNVENDGLTILILMLRKAIGQNLKTMRFFKYHKKHKATKNMISHYDTSLLFECKKKTGIL